MQAHPIQTHLPFEYDGKASAIIVKIAKYAAMNLVTLFIYRFWTKTHLRRYFWSSVRLDGESFAYHGTGKELFIGFVIFFCLFFCFYVVNELLLLFLADSLWYFIYSAIVVIGFTYLFHMAIFRMLKYRLSRTSWRGVRFGLDGKARHYAGKALLLLVVSILSLGLAYPWVRASLINYRLRRCRFGNSHFTSHLKGRQLALAYYISKLPLLIMLGVLITTAVLTYQITTDIISSDAVKDSLAQVALRNPALPILFIIALIAAFLLGIFYRLFEAKTTLSHLRFQQIRFTNNLKLISSAIGFAVLSVLYYALIFFSMFSIGFIFGFNPWLLFLIYPIYVVYLFTSIALMNWIIARLIVGTSLEGDIDILKDVSSYRKDEPTHGEGLFEILDIGNI